MSGGKHAELAQACQGLDWPFSAMLLEQTRSSKPGP